MTAHEKEKVIKYGYEKWKKRCNKWCVIDLLCNFIFIGLIEISLLFFPSKISSVKWIMEWVIGIGIALFIILTILYIIHYKRKIKDYKDCANEHWLNITRFGNDYEIRFDEYVMVTLSDEEVNDLLYTEIV